MKKVEVQWVQRYQGANQSIDLVRWCRQQGLRDRVDFNWQFKADENLTAFYFEDHCESFATLFALKWVAT
jgi:hypothetical protein